MLVVDHFAPIGVVLDMDRRVLAQFVCVETRGRRAAILTMLIHFGFVFLYEGTFCESCRLDNVDSCVLDARGEIPS